MENIVKWMPIAQLDLDDIYQYYSSKSEQVAVNMWNRILDSAEPLKTFAYLGPVEPLLLGREKEYRSLVIEKHYKLIYYVDGRKVTITGVWDTRRNPDFLSRMMK